MKNDVTNYVTPFLRYRASINYTYSNNGSIVDSVNSKKDLGVLFNCELNFHLYTETIKL